MPKVFGTVRLTWIEGEFGRFRAESWSRPGEHHMVDVCARHPLGRCTCEAYSCRHWPEFKKTLKPVRCRHLIAAREALLNRILAEHGKLSGDGE